MSAEGALRRLSPATGPMTRLEPTTRLVCFPYAGAGASVFRDWAALVPGNVEVWAAQLPGREERFHDEPATRLDDVLNELVPAMLPLLDRPYTFFGHSLGALVCWELARSLQMLQLAQPAQVIVSGYQAPQPRPSDPDPPLYALPDDELVEELRAMGGTPDDSLRNPELMQLLLPVIRADLELTETYAFRPGEPLTCALAAFGGEDDPRIEIAELGRWAAHTTGQFTAVAFPGDHFYLHASRAALVDRVISLLPQTHADGREAGRAV